MQIEDHQKHQNDKVLPQELAPQQNGKLDQVKCSPYLSKYKAKLLECKIKNIEQYSQELRNNNIFYNSKTYQEHPHFTIISHSNQYKVARLAVSFSFFTVQVLVLNFDVLSPTRQNLPTIGFGSYSQVFQLETLFHKKYEKVAIKSVRIQSSQVSVMKANENFNSAIFQYSLCKLFSVLQIGPYIPSLFGFDLFIYGDSIEFAMELCSRPCFEQIHNLNQDLATMHSFQVIHGDIKPQNIMWSQKYDKNVFIDFGLAKILTEKIGEMSFTHFFGTYSYCSEEMKKLFFYDKKFDYIDLYYNDMLALEKSVRLFYNESFKKNEPAQQKGKKRYLNQLLNFQVVSLVFEQDLEGIQKFVTQFPSLDILPETLNFFQEIDWSKTIARIIAILTNSYYFPSKESKQLILFSKLKSFTQPNKQKGVGFKSRVNQLAKQFNGTINEIMLFMLIYYHVDITPKAKYASQLLKQKLLKFEAQQQDWQNLIKFSMNPYVDIQDLEKVFEIVKGKINISEWDKENKKQLRTFIRSKKIADAAKAKFGINLYQMKDQLQKSQSDQNDLEVQSQLSFLVELQKQLLQCPNKGIEYFCEFIKKKLESEPLRFSKTVADLIVKAYNFDHKSIKSYEEMQSFLSNFKYFKTAFKTKPLTLQSQNIISQYWFRLNIYQTFDLFVNFFSKQSLYVFDQQKCILICAYDRIHFHLMKPQQNLALFKSQISSMLRFAQQLNNKEAFLSCFSTLYKAFSISYEIHPFQIMIEHAKIIYEASQTLLRAINYKFSYNQLNYVFVIVSSLPVQPFPQIQQFVSQILCTAKQLSKNMTPYQFYGYVLDRIGIARKYELCSKQVCCQQLRGYIKLFRRQKDLNLKQNTFKFRMYSTYLLLAVSCRFDPREQFLDFIKLAFEQIQSFEDYPQYVYVAALYFSEKPVVEFAQFLDFVLKIMKSIPKQCEREENFYISTCLQFLVLRYLLNKKQHFPELQQLFKSEIMKVFHQNPQRFCLDFANSLIILEILLKLSFIQKSVFEKQSILGMLNVASLIVEHCIFSIKRSFMNSMTVWSLEFVNDSIFELSQRKVLILKLKCLRNWQFIRGRREAEQQLLWKCKNRRNQAYDLLCLKLDDLRTNKLLQVEFTAVSNIKRQYAHRQYVMLNSSTPNIVNIVEQYFFSKL